MSRTAVRSVTTTTAQRPREYQSLDDEIAHEELRRDLRATSLRSCGGIETVTMRAPNTSNDGPSNTRTAETGDDERSPCLHPRERS